MTVTAAPEIQRAPNYGYYRERLADPGLLERAVLTPVSGHLAVPVGGVRRSGECSVRSRAEGRAMVKLLREHEGFPNVRLDHRPENHSWNVEWGEPVGMYAADEERGTLYGYSRAVIDAFLHRWPDGICGKEVT